MTLMFKKIELPKLSIILPFFRCKTNATSRRYWRLGWNLWRAQRCRLGCWFESPCYKRYLHYIAKFCCRSKFKHWYIFCLKLPQELLIFLPKYGMLLMVKNCLNWNTNTSSNLLTFLKTPNLWPLHPMTRFYEFLTWKNPKSPNSILKAILQELNKLCTIRMKENSFLVTKVIIYIGYYILILIQNEVFFFTYF